jgi:hypothetical protein
MEAPARSSGRAGGSGRVRARTSERGSSRARSRGRCAGRCSGRCLSMPRSGRRADSRPWRARRCLKPASPAPLDIGNEARARRGRDLDLVQRLVGAQPIGVPAQHLPARAVIVQPLAIGSRTIWSTLRDAASRLLRMRARMSKRRQVGGLTFRRKYCSSSKPRRHSGRSEAEIRNPS